MNVNLPSCIKGLNTWVRYTIVLVYVNIAKFMLCNYHLLI